MSNGPLQLLMVDVVAAGRQAMFQADSVRLDLDRAGVPRLDIDDDYFVGSTDIPERFPGIVEAALAADGVELAAGPGPRGGDRARSSTQAAWPSSSRPADDGGEAVLPVGDDGPARQDRQGPCRQRHLHHRARGPRRSASSPCRSWRCAGSLPAFPSWLVIVLAAHRHRSWRPTSPASRRAAAKPSAARSVTATRSRRASTPRSSASPSACSA